MAQGIGKLTKSKPAKGGKKVKQQPKKGRRTVTPKRKHALNTQQVETTKAINRKNEACIAAKAVASGTQFFLSDISKKGSDKLTRQIKERNKRQTKSNHLQKQLSKLKR